MRGTGGTGTIKRASSNAATQEVFNNSVEAGGIGLFATHAGRQGSAVSGDAAEIKQEQSQAAVMRETAHIDRTHPARKLRLAPAEEKLSAALATRMAEHITTHFYGDAALVFLDRERPHLSANERVHVFENKQWQDLVSGSTLRCFLEYHAHNEPGKGIFTVVDDAGAGRPRVYVSESYTAAREAAQRDSSLDISYTQLRRCDASQKKKSEEALQHVLACLRASRRLSKAKHAGIGKRKNALLP